MHADDPARAPAATDPPRAGGPPPGLREVAPLAALHERPWDFGFFQAVRLLYRVHGLPPRLGASAPDKVRFGTPASLSFPPGEIDDLATGPDGRINLVVNFLGLTGPSGILPRHYTEWLLARRQARDRATADFLDLFNHRLTGLFWRAWAKHRIDINREFETGRGALRYIYDLIGVGTPSLYARIAPRTGGARPEPARLPGAALGYYSGLIAQRPHGTASIGRVIADVVGAEVQVAGCHGTLQRVPPADRTRLGGRASRLSDGCVLGSVFWDRQTTLLLRIGPLGRAQFESLLPCGGLLAGVVELLRFLTGLALDLHIKLALRADEVPVARLGGDSARLGWNTWLGGRRARTPADECTFPFSGLAPGNA